jgi:DNA-binding transcriptional regulator YiaG
MTDRDLDLDIDLKGIRKELGDLTQETFAQLIGRSAWTVRMWEQGRGKIPIPLVLLINRIVADHRASVKAAA